MTNSHIPSGVFSGRAKSASTTYPNLPGISVVTIAPVARAIDTLYYEPMILDTRSTLDELWLEVTTLAAAGVARMGIVAADANWQPLGSAIVTSGEIDTSTTGIKKATALAIPLSAGRYLRLVRFGVVGPTVRIHRGSIRGAPFVTGMGASGSVITLTKAEAYAATFSAPVTPWDTATGGSTPFENTVLCVLSEVT